MKNCKELSDRTLKSINGGSEASLGFFRFLGYVWQKAVDLPESKEPGTEMWLTFI